jgi:hypothetical protein
MGGYRTLQDRIRGRRRGLGGRSGALPAKRCYPGYCGNVSPLRLCGPETHRAGVLRSGGRFWSTAFATRRRDRRRGPGHRKIVVMDFDGAQSPPKSDFPFKERLTGLMGIGVAATATSGLLTARTTSAITFQSAPS